jgi:hypothetical protein
MYARIEQLAIRPEAQPGTPATGLAGSVTLQDLDVPGIVRITLHAHGSGPDAGRYQVMAAEPGPAAGRAPTHAQVLYFHGPRAPEQAAAAEVAGRQRIWPAIREVPGLVAQWVLRGPAASAVVCTLATSRGALDEISAAALATELLPGEDPALLPGPDRVQTGLVIGYRPASHDQPATAGGPSR